MNRKRPPSPVRVEKPIAAKRPDPSEVRFSFKYLEVREGFDYSGKAAEYFTTAIERLKHLSGWKVLDLRQQGGKTLRCHRIDWADTTERAFGILGEEQLVDEPWQFSISANEHGRVLGFWIDSTFYVRWFDPGHRLYS